MNIYNNTIMSQWPTAGYGFSDSAAPSNNLLKGVVNNSQYVSGM